MRAWRAAILYAGLTVVIAFPLSIHPATRVLSDSADTDLIAWLLSWDVHAFTHRPWAIFDANIFAPLRHTLAFSENLIGSALFAAPIIWTTGNAVLAMNLIALLTCAACGAGAYVLARRAGIGEAGATLAGLVFAFAPPRFLRLDQLFLATIAWMPFALAFFHAYLDDGRPRDLRIAASFFVLQALTSGHGAVFLTLAGIVLFAPRILAGRTRVRLSRLPRDLGLPGLALLAVMIFVAVPYEAAQSAVGLRRSLGDWRVLHAGSLLAAPTYVQGWLLSRLLPDAHINETADAYLFPGWIALALAACALTLREASGRALTTGRDAVWRAGAGAADVGAIAAALAGVIVAFTGPLRLKVGDLFVISARQPWRACLVAILFAGVRLAIARRVPVAPMSALRRARAAVGSWLDARRRDPMLPYAALVVLSLWLAIGPPFGLWPFVYWLPGFNFIRATSRFTLVGLLGLAVLAGAGFERLASRLTRRARTTAAIALGVLLFAECLVPLEGVDYRVDIPAIDRWLATQPAPFIVAEVPLPDLRSVALFGKRQSTYMLHSTAHWQKTVHGWGGVVPPAHFDLWDALTRFPDDESLRQLDAFKVDYVVVHRDLYAPDEWSALVARLPAYASRLVLVHSDAGGSVYAMRRGRE